VTTQQEKSRARFTGAERPARSSVFPILLAMPSKRLAMIASRAPSSWASALEVIA